MELDFTVDWSGVASGLSKGLLQYSQLRSQTKVELAKQKAAQAAALAAMQQPPAPYPPAVAPSASAPMLYRQQAATMPQWALPAAVAAVLALMVLSRR